MHRATRAAGVPTSANGASKEPGPNRERPCKRPGPAATRLSLTLKDLKKDSSSVVFPRPASPTTIRLKDSRGGSRESRGSMLRLW